jgi:hypothetical protein
MIHDMIMAAAGAAGPAGPTDADFENTVLLLHGDGTNGAQNNTFLDSSTNNFTITRNGNTTQGTFSPFSKPDGRWGNYFDGSGDYLTWSGSAITTNQFCFECWFYCTGSYGSQQVLFGPNSATNGGISIRIASSTRIDIDRLGVGASQFTVPTLALNTWNHLVAVRDGSNNTTVFVNGTRSSTGTISDSYSYLPAASVGALNSGTPFPFTGYISNARIIVGSTPYDPTSSTITVPTSPLTAVSNTSLLTCQSNRFKDNSSNAFAITRNGDVKVTPFSPFPITTAYSPTVNGGAGYFDGSGDYLSVADNAALEFGGSDFTIECWIYPQSIANNSIVFCKHSSSTGSWIIFRSGANLQFFCSSDGSNWDIVNAATIGTVSVNQWFHVAVTRSGTSFRCFLNGSLGSTTTSSSSVYNGTQPVVLGINEGNTQDPYAGYISNARIVIGTAVYTAAFTPPTAPPTAIANTAFLCNFTNAGILDNTGFNALETVGNAQVDTSVVKYGTGSMKFDGTGDYLLMNGGENFAFGSGDFTIEMWINFSSNTNQAIFYDSRPASTNGFYPMLYMESVNKKFVYYVNSTNRITSSTAVSTSTWYHIAVTRSGTNTKLFVNGSQEGSTYTDSNVYVNGLNRPVLGADGLTIGTSPFNGYIDDLRITKGIARYTSNFTPPTAALPDVGV